MSKKERFALHDAPGMIRDEVEALIPLVRRLYGYSPVYVQNTKDAEGYVHERPTEHGCRAAKEAADVALHSFALLGSATGMHGTPTPHHQLLDTLEVDAAKLFQALLAPLTPAAGIAGYLTVDHGENAFTERAWKLAGQAHAYAESAGRDLWQTAGTIRPSDDRFKALDGLAYEGGYTLAAVTSALAGIPGADYPTAVVGGVERLLERLRELAKAEGVGVGNA